MICDRFEVLFWGLRDLKRVQFLPVTSFPLNFIVIVSLFVRIMSQCLKTTYSPQLYFSLYFCVQVDRLEDELMGEQEKLKGITEELEQTFAEMSGY